MSVELALTVLIAIIAANYFAARFLARRAFDKLTRQRDGMMFVPFDDCSIDRCTGVVTARMQCDVTRMLKPNDQVMMSINGIMTEMTVAHTRSEYLARDAEIGLQDTRSYRAQRYVP